MLHRGMLMAKEAKDFRHSWAAASAPLSCWEGASGQDNGVMGHPVSAFRVNACE